MIGAMACFIVNDSLVKYASQTMPAAQLIFVRGVMASLLVLAVAQAMGATRRIREIARGWVAVRAVVDAIATMLFLVSLFHLPLANATAINMASPLIITVLAAVFLGERLGLSRWVASASASWASLLHHPAAGRRLRRLCAGVPAVDRAAFGARSRDPAGARRRSVHSGHAVEHGRRHAARGRAVVSKAGGRSPRSRSGSSPSSPSSCRPRITSS